MAAAGLRFSFGAVRHRPTAARRVQRLLKKFCQAAGANPQVGCAGRRLVQHITLTEAADPAYSVQTLLKST
jgi:hypothetical protein